MKKSKNPEVGAWVSTLFFQWLALEALAPLAAARALTLTAKKVAKGETRVMVRKLFYLCTLGSSSNLTAIPFKSGPTAG